MGRRIKDFDVEAQEFSQDDFIPLDGESAGTRKMSTVTLQELIGGGGDSSKYEVENVRLQQQSGVGQAPLYEATINAGKLTYIREGSTPTADIQQIKLTINNFDDTDKPYFAIIETSKILLLSTLIVQVSVVQGSVITYVNFVPADAYSSMLLGTGESGTQLYLVEFKPNRTYSVHRISNGTAVVDFDRFIEVKCNNGKQYFDYVKYLINYDYIPFIKTTDYGIAFYSYKTGSYDTPVFMTAPNKNGMLQKITFDTTGSSYSVVTETISLAKTCRNLTCETTSYTKQVNAGLLAGWNNDPLTQQANPMYPNNYAGVYYHTALLDTGTTKDVEKYRTVPVGIMPTYVATPWTGNQSDFQYNDLCTAYGGIYRKVLTGEYGFSIVNNEVIFSVVVDGVTTTYNTHGTTYNSSQTYHEGDFCIYTENNVTSIYVCDNNFPFNVYNGWAAKASGTTSTQVSTTGTFDKNSWVKVDEHLFLTHFQPDPLHPSSTTAVFPIWTTDYGILSKSIQETYLTERSATDAAVIDIVNNKINVITSQQSDLTLKVTLFRDEEVPNFAVELTAEANITLTVVKKNFTTGTETTLCYSALGGNTVESGKFYQITCVGNCWTLAEFIPPPQPPTVTIGDKTYNVVTIGNQEWLAENLDYAWNGLNVDPSSSLWGVPIACHYNKDDSTYGWNGKKWGLLYNQDAINYMLANESTMFPDGWHVPTSTDYNTLVSTISADSDWKAGMASTEDWDTSFSQTTEHGLDKYGLNIKPLGEADLNSRFYFSNNDDKLAVLWATDKEYWLELPYNKFTWTQYEIDNYYDSKAVRLVRNLT